MDLIIIVGPPAVGKMTVGLALSRRTGFPLFHNHVTIEAVRAVFSFDHPAFWGLVGEFRRRIFEEAVRGGPPGLIFTYIWSFDDPTDKTYIDGLAGIVEAAGGTVRFVELTTTFDERQRRNEHADRLAAKPSKRDLAVSRQHLLDVEKSGRRLNTAGDFSYPDRHLLIDNTSLTPDRVAEQIVAAWNLPTGHNSDRPAAAAEKSLG